MVKLRDIVRGYRDAAGVNSLLALWGFVDDGVVLTKAGHLVIAWRVRGVDFEGLTHAQRASLTHRMEAALRLLDEHCRLYQYFFKQNIPTIELHSQATGVARDAIERRAEYLNERRKSLYDLSFYYVLVYEPPALGWPRREWYRRPSDACRSWLSMRGTTCILEAELDRSIQTVREKARTVEIQLSEYGLDRLGKADAFRFFRRLVNANPIVAEAAPLVSDAFLDYFVADTAVECHRDHLMVGDRVVKALSMKEPPSRTFAYVLGDLQRVPGEFVACLEWQRVSNDRMRRELRVRRRHFFNKRVSLVNYVAPETKPEEMLVDDSATASMNQLGDALTELEVNGHFFGLCSLTVVLRGDDVRQLQQATAEAMKAMAAHDGCFFEETYNLLNAWLATVPGNGAHNLRRLALLETNAADLSFIFGSTKANAIVSIYGKKRWRCSRRRTKRLMRSTFTCGTSVTRSFSERPEWKELSDQLRGDSRAEVCAVHRHPGSWTQLPEAGDAARRSLSRGRPRAARRRHDQSVRLAADGRASAFPACVHEGAARRCGRLPRERSRGP